MFLFLLFLNDFLLKHKSVMLISLKTDKKHIKSFCYDQLQFLFISIV